MDQQHVLIVPPRAELHFHSPEGASILALCISTNVLRQFQLCDDLTCFTAGQSAMIIDAPHFVGRARQDIVDGLSKVGTHPDPLALGRILAASLLTNLRTEIALRSDMSGMSGQARKIKNVMSTIELFRSAPHEPLTYDFLSDYTGASRRSLQSSFKDVVGCGPFDYQRQLRLCHARSKLSANGATPHSIANIAAEVGFFDVSHFSRAYKNLFSETPSRTRDRLAPVGRSVALARLRK